MSLVPEFEIHFLDEGEVGLAVPLVTHREAARKVSAIDNGHGEEASLPQDYMHDPAVEQKVEGPPFEPLT